VLVQTLPQDVAYLVCVPSFVPAGVAAFHFNQLR